MTGMMQWLPIDKRAVEERGALERSAADGAFAPSRRPGDGEIALSAAMRVRRMASELMTDLGYPSKINAERTFPTVPRDEGRPAAEAFLAAHAEDLGHRSSLDIARLLV